MPLVFFRLVNSKKIFRTFYSFFLCRCYWIFFPQSRNSAKFFLQSSELGPPTPSHAGECVPHLWFPGEGGALACERGGGVVPVRTRGQTLWYSRYTCIQFALFVLLPLFFKIAFQGVLLDWPSPITPFVNTSVCQGCRWAGQVCAGCWPQIVARPDCPRIRPSSCRSGCWQLVLHPRDQCANS
jgi:hypothetical protein